MRGFMQPFVHQILVYTFANSFAWKGVWPMNSFLFIIKLFTIAFASISLAACSSGGGSDSGGSPSSSSPTVLTFGAGTNPGGIGKKTPRFAFATNEDNTISQYIVASPGGELRHNGYSLAGTNPGVVVVDPTGQFAYVPNQGDNTVSAYSISETGELIPVASGPFQTGIGPIGAVIHPSGQFLYVGNFNGGTIQGYTINSVGGALAPVGPPTPAGIQPAELAIEPSGRFLYVANSGSNTVSAFSIDVGTGVLTPIAGSPFPVANTPLALAVDPKGRVLFVANLNSNSVTAFAIHSVSGALLSPKSLTTGSFPTALTVDLTGQFLFVTNGGDDTISVFSINQSSGLITDVSGSPFPSDVTPVTISIDPSGAFVYVTNTDSSTVSIHRLNPISGALSLIQTSRTRVSPTAFAFSSGTTSVNTAPKFAYVANQGSNSISAFGINSSTGALSGVSGSPFAAGMQPVFITSDPKGRFVYAINSGSNNITAYQVNSGNGSLTAISGSPFATGNAPVGAAVDPTGRFLYVASAQANTISVFSINSATGVLTAIGPAISLAQTPITLAMDPTGQFVFTGTTLGAIYSHRIHPTTGALTEVPGFPYPGPGLPPVPTALVVDATGKYLFSGGSSGLGGIYLRTINPITGALESGFHFGFSNTFTPQGMAVDPLGKYLYVAYVSQSDVFSIQQTAPGLQRIPGSPFGRIGDSIAVDPSGQYLYSLDTRCGATPCNGSVIAQSVDPGTGSLSAPTSTALTQFLNFTMTLTRSLQ